MIALQREQPAGALEQPAGALEQSSTGGLLRLRLDLSYDGTEFHGWARQPGLRSVQEEVERALRAVLRIPLASPVRVAVAGRTDAGVHAIGQVGHCDVPASVLASREVRGPVTTPSPTPHDIAQPDPWEGRASGPDSDTMSGPGGASGPGEGELGTVLRRLNGVLPGDVRVRRLRLAPDGFDARWSAAWREYSYLVADDPQDADPRRRNHVLTAKPLDVAAMHAAARPFVGEHDFTAYCRARPDASSVRTIHAVQWHRQAPLGDGSGLAELRIRSDAFCHSMVRALVGAFLAVGEGRWSVDRPKQLLAAGVRVPAIPTAPAHGLTLTAVGYPVDAQLGEQARRARRWRGD